jgi:hypothetical protein
VTVGRTLATSTTWTLSESLVVASSESCTFIFTLAVAGPFGKKHLKLPPGAVAVYDPATSVPLSLAFASQSGKPADASNVSWPGSLIVNV